MSWTLSGTRNRAACLMFAVATLSTMPAFAAIKHDETAKTWTLTSGANEYRLSERGAVLSLENFRLTSAAVETRKAKAVPEINGIVEGVDLATALRIVSAQQRQLMPGVDEVSFKLQEASLGLELEVTYAAWAETGVFTRQISLVNKGQRAIEIEKLPSLSMSLGKGRYTLRTLYGGWGQEHQLSTETLGIGGRSFGSATGRSTNGFAPWISLRNESTDTEYLAELAWSGNWDAHLWRQPPSHDDLMDQAPVAIEMGVHWDFGGGLRLSPGAKVDLPKVAFTMSHGDLDDVANQMHRYQRAFVFPQTSVNRPPLVQFNSWYPLPGKLTLNDMEKLADSAAKLGAEVFVQDAGWYGTSDSWPKQIGDYYPSPVVFPHGMEEFSDYLKSRHLKFGLWVEIETVGRESKMLAQHPDWCMQYEGKQMAHASRCHLNFAKPEVRQWATDTVDRLVNSYHLAWMKIDYNVDIGDRFDPQDEGRTGDVLAKHIQAYYDWLDSVRARHPELIIENCASGALRMDTGILAHTHTSWLSDNINPIDSVQLAYGCTVQFAPEVCNHWMVGDTPRGTVDLAKSPGWWDFMFRVPMNGQFGISSRTFDWNDELTQHAKNNVALYKEIRSTIAHADVYHLTPEPTHKDPKGWMAIQYVDPKSDESVLMTYRLGQGEPQQLFHLRGLNADTMYRVSVEDKPVVKRKGSDLMNAGLEIELTKDWRATVVRIKSR